MNHQARIGGSYEFDCSCGFHQSIEGICRSEDMTQDARNACLFQYYLRHVRASVPPEEFAKIKKKLSFL